MNKPYPSVIAITGRLGSGKTTIAKHLELNHHYVRVRFAEILKDMLRALGLTKEEVDGSLKETPSSLLFDQTPRHAMQTLGTEWGRNLIHQDLWAHAWKVRAAEQLALGHKVVCDDCRFENEEVFVRHFHGAQIWRVLRLEKDTPAIHPSEKDLAFIQHDASFANYGSVKDLQVMVDTWLAGET